MKEGLEEDLERLKSRKDDMLTIAEIGVDQLIVDEMQEFRKLSFATNQTTLKGIDPEGSQRAWDLYVKVRFIDSTNNPGRALVAASGTPITNSLAELFTVQRFVQPHALEELRIHQFDAWAANFGETRTELELQPSGLYKPVTRFCEFVNVPDLMAIYRMVTDVVLKSDLRQYLKLPAIAGGRRQIVAAPASEAFLAYQQHLARADQGDRRTDPQTRERRRHPAVRHHRRPPCRDRSPLRPIRERQRPRQQAQRPDRQGFHRSGNKQRTIAIPAPMACPMPSPARRK